MKKSEMRGVASYIGGMEMLSKQSTTRASCLEFSVVEAKSLISKLT